MYLEFFKISEYPFTLTPNTGYYCDLPTHREAMNVLIYSLRSGEGFIKIVGEVGTGKTLLCRLLLNQLDSDKFVTTYIPNPDLTPNGLRKALAYELDIKANTHDQHTLVKSISEKLLEHHANNKNVVLFVDEAQTLSDESLEALRLLTNLETESHKLLQIVLFGQPELDMRLDQNNLRQLKQRITFSYYLNPITRPDLDAYLCHRLSKAGHTQGQLFNHQARDLLFTSSQGTPRLINILSHKAMMFAFGKGDRVVTQKAVQQAIIDTKGSLPPKKWPWMIIFGCTGLTLLIVLCLEIFFIQRGGI